MWLSAQASRDEDSLVPITSTTASACFATATASSIRARFFCGSPKTTSSLYQFAGCSVMRVPSAYSTSTPVPAFCLMPSSRLTPRPGLFE